MDNEQMKTKFLNQMQQKGYAPRTIEGYQSDLNRFLDYLAAKQKKIPLITITDLEQYRTTLYYQEHRGKPLSLATQHHQLTVIRVFFHFLAAQNLILINPAANLELPKCPRGLPRTILSVHESKKILESIDTTDYFGLRDRTILEVLYSTGIRVTELINLTLTDLDFGQGLIRIENGKGNKTRVVPFGTIAAHYTKKYLEIRTKTQQTTLFLSKRSGLPLDRQTIKMISINRALQAGIKKKVTPHVWRHTCATLMLKSGADIRYIQELLGHASLKTTQVYTKVTVQDLKKVHAKCHPRNKD